MGGIGSGSYSRLDAKRTVESCRSLSIKRLLEIEAIKPNSIRISGLEWKNSRTKEVESSIRYKSDMMHEGHEYINLMYRITKTGEEFDYKVRIDITYPNYGGKRYWFCCPCCHKRCLFLYCAYKIYACRKCNNLTYNSSQENHEFNVLRKAQKISQELGGGGHTEQWFDKPKGMHWKTFNTKIAEMRHYERMSIMMMNEKLRIRFDK